ncbi:MAG: alpha-L-fucosidase [Eubacterium sp.]
MEIGKFNALYNHSYSEERRYVPPKEPEVLASIEKFRDRKFGIMFHWGAYSQWGIVESWALPDADHSWAWDDVDKDLTGEQFKQEYWDLIKTFNPVRFRPEEWAKTAKDAGFKYVLFTTKHHDGFCMWDTKYSDYKITSPQCPFSKNPRADICKHLFDAFRNEGLKVHAYFSKPDWHSEYYWAKGFSKNEYMTRNPSYKTYLHPRLWNKFCEYTKNQMLELVENYGRIECLWLDGGQVNPMNMQNIHLGKIMKEARKIQPWLMVADRTVGGKNENFITPEQTVPDRPIKVPWESCVTLGTSFSFKYDDNYKDAKTIIHLLCDIVAKGGNLALNIGPRPDGRLPHKVYPILSDIGQWLQKNGYAIYETRPAEPYRKEDFAYTGKNNEVYAIYLPYDGNNTLPCSLTMYSNERINKVTFNSQNVEFTQQGDRVSVTLPKNYEKEPAYVLTMYK